MSGTATSKPRVRVAARSTPLGGAGAPTVKAFASDSFQNFIAGMGIGTNTLASGGTYGFNPISRNRNLLEWAYRGSWMVKQVVDSVAEDMTRAGVHVDSEMSPDDVDTFQRYMRGLQIWQRLNATIKWARLYGGAVAVMMIDGQDTAQPLRVETVGKGQFKGLLVLDRWMLWPHVEDPVTTLGPDFGTPRYYDVVADARTVPSMRIHHSRVVRMTGVELPYWQKMAENDWGLSVIEPMWDRLLAFDSATQGAAQLVYKAHLRVLRMEKYRENIAMGGPMFSAVQMQLAAIRALQSSEGLTVIDQKDEFSATSTSFAGLSDALIQFGQQLSGAAQIPLVRLFGQSPAGMNATGDSDIRNYYDAINARQEAMLREPVGTILGLCYRSAFGQEPPEELSFSFNPLWQMSHPEKVSYASTLATAISGLDEAAIIDRATALSELRESARVTGIFSNVTEEDIRQARLQPPPQAGEGGPGLPPTPTGASSPSGDQPASPLVAAEADDSASATPHAAIVRRALGRLGDPIGDIVARVGERSSAAAELRRAELAANPQVEVTVNHRDAAPGLPMVDYQGLTLVIETPKGTRRTGYGWSTLMPVDYGYVSGTSSAEGPTEQLDCFLGPDRDSGYVWVIDQFDPSTNAFDEHKCMLGFRSKGEALAAYEAAFEDGSASERIGDVRRLTVEDFKSWLEKRPYGAASYTRDRGP